MMKRLLLLFLVSGLLSCVDGGKNTRVSNKYGHMSYQLDISPQALETLEKCRLSAIERGVLADNNQTYVNATLKVNRSKYAVKVKLKGALKSHWTDPSRWSFRVVVKNGFCIENGLKVFSLQSGTQRGNLVEHYYHHFLKSHGLIYMKYENIDFSINGDTLPNYVIEEFFDSPMLANNNRTEGPILKYTYDEYWETVDWLNPDLTMLSIMEVFDQTYHSAPVKSFKFKSGRQGNWKTLSQEAIQKLDGFRNGTLKARDVFDFKLMGKYFAINSLFGSQHPAFVTNLRFYYNPKTKLIEPIGYDMELIRDLTLANEADRLPNYWPHKVSLPLFTAQLFSDPLVRGAYISGLQDIADHVSIDDLQETFKNEISFYKELEGSKFDDHLEILKSNLAEIRAELKRLDD